MTYWIDLTRTRLSKISSRYTSHAKISVSIKSLFTFTGCDTISSFAGKCKLKTYKKVQKKDSYQEALSLLGSDVSVSSYVFSNNTAAWPEISRKIFPGMEF